MGGLSFEIIGTDISQEVLEKAKVGIYSQFEVQRGLPVQMLLKYFKQTGEMWQISPEIRSMVTYRPFNLLDNYSPMGKFDVIFCRNVLIYFDQSTKSDVMARLAKQMPEDGYLLLGAAETVVGLTNSFQAVPGKRGLYVNSASAAASGGLTQPQFRAAAGSNGGLADRTSGSGASTSPQRFTSSRFSTINGGRR